MNFVKVLNKYRKFSFSEHDKGSRFERLMKAYLISDPTYANKFKKVWLWSEFPGRGDLGGSDTGIDLVALTFEGDYWAIQCKCFQEDAVIDKAAVDSFITTSGRSFKNEELKTVRFSHRLWISTTNKWGLNATEAIKNQNPPFTRLNLFDLIGAPIDWEKLDKGIHGDASRTPKKSLYLHQKEALDKTHEHFKKFDRGKLILACGTGKTFNSLRIAENETNGKGLILFLVPSIALLGQTLREWTSDAIEPINAICICSDPLISSRRNKNNDSDQYSIIDLALPASTNTKEILKQFNQIRNKNTNGMIVVFSTYQSIDVISKAQKELLKNDFDEFDLIICDEAHRTTGVKLSNENESAFIKVHDNNFIKAKKRLYMTATPRLYSDDVKSKAAQSDAILCSMDDPKLYGDEIYRIGFGEAVERDLLTDYKVLILTLNENDVPPSIQKIIANKDSEINSDDAGRLIGCINALSKQVLGDEGILKKTDPDPMRRAVAFCQTIATSKKITSTFNEVTDLYINSLPETKKENMVSVSSKHMDGTMSAPVRDELLTWLKADTENNECKILTNVRCLSEGVDVPSLDSVLFLSARNSQIDVVQSVGRVMRKSPNKKYGYIIIPVLVPANIEADKALDDNKRYKVVWTVLNALRAHDDRFNATVNKIELNKNRPEQILVGRPDVSFDKDGNPISTTDGDNNTSSANLSEQISLQFEQLQSVVFARMVNKVGDRRYWEQWAKSVAEIAQKHEDRINKLLRENISYKKTFDKFLEGLQNNINPNISTEVAIEMLSQHLITAPVFDALFKGYSFVKNNPISIAMQKMLDILDEHALEKENKSLEKFYDSIKKRIEGIDNAEGKQKIILELYEKYFKTAMPKMVEKLGIVYTPVEVVDFIIHSVNDILKKEFDRTISDENIHILDPFTGTGTFLVRLLQSGLIDAKDLERKYKDELHANEIVLLAYYIAAINIETAYHDATPDPDDGVGKANYTSFDGIVLTDTFQLSETREGEIQYEEMLKKNSDRVERQKKAPIKIIIGNPPYSVGQKSKNDIAKNQSYPKLENRILETYIKASNDADTSSNSLKKFYYDAYVKAFRWGTDRLDKTGGIISFVSNGGWINSNSLNGFRLSLQKEFSSIYVFDLRGNQVSSGELSKKEGGKIFGSGSRTPISITLLVKNPEIKSDTAKIFYRDIGDYLSREEKLKIISKYKSVSTIPFTEILPNEQGDWIKQRSEGFENLIELAPEKKQDQKASTFFIINTNGVVSGRSNWVNNFSSSLLKSNVNRMIDFLNSQTDEYKLAIEKNTKLNVNEFIDTDESKIKWDDKLIRKVKQGKHLKFDAQCLRKTYRTPFCKEIIYFNEDLNWSRVLLPKVFPTPSTSNLIISCIGKGASREFSVLISDNVIDYHFEQNGQCFPLHYYEENKASQKGLFDTDESQKYVRRDAISDFILERAKQQYGKSVTKEDIFYYVYGFLHSKEYRETFSNDLKKMLPRLPLVETVTDFWAFSKAGRKLAELHLNYETVAPSPDVTITGDDGQNYTVDKMRFPKKDQKETIHYNSKITVSNIPAMAYEYVVNGKSAIDWIMERYAVTTHKESGIVNDPNDWSKEVGNPRYILDLLLSIINVSVQTVEIVNSLPNVKFE